MNEVSDLVGSRALVLLLAACRVSGIVILAPLPWAVAPARVRAALVLLLAFVAASGPLEPAAGIGDRPLLLALATCSELVIGACLGLVVRLVVAAAEVAADIAAPQLGLGVAQLFDPHAQVSESPLGALLRRLVVVLAVVTGLHRKILAAWFGSFDVIEPGALVSPAGAAGTVLALTAETVEVGFRIALPVVAILFLVQVGLAFIARAAPALQIFSVGFAVTLGVGLLVIVLCLPDTVRVLLAEFSRVDARIEALLGALLEASP